MFVKTWEPFIRNTSFYQQLRTTYILKRRFEAPLANADRQPRLRNRFQVYETIQDHKGPPDAPPKVLTLLLEKYVGDVGRPGEIVQVEDRKARLLILNKSAVYPSPENLAKAKNLVQESYSSKFAGATVMGLSRLVLAVTMNKERPWTIEPWHVRVAFRKAHVHVPEECITMPKNPISGPDPKLQGKEFYITVKINNKEIAPVRCRIHHWATEIEDRLPVVKKHDLYPAEPIFPEDDEIAKTLPEIIPPPTEDSLYDVEPTVMKL